MSITISSTKTASSHGIKCLIHGQSGSGKTYLARTLPGKTLIISAESGLLSLRDCDLPVIQVLTLADVREAFTYLSTDKEGQGYNNIVLDSLSEIAEVVLEAEKLAVKDPRMAYGALAEQVVALVKAFRDLPGRNVIFIAKSERQKDEMTGALLVLPSFPGLKLAQNIPYLLDEVLYLRVDRDKDGNLVRTLQTQRDYQVEAKDRSGALEQYEPADLGAIFKKITGGKK